MGYPPIWDFVRVADHRTLVWLYSFEDPEGAIARWLKKLGHFDMEVRHNAGNDIPHLDCLTRVHLEEEGITKFNYKHYGEKLSSAGDDRLLLCH